jgi:hypothetical protein
VTDNFFTRAEVEQALDAALFAPGPDPEEIAAWAKMADYRDCFVRRRVPTPRKPSIRRMIAAAEKTGKTVTSITLPDGTVLQFGASDERNEWDTVLRHGPN